MNNKGFTLVEILAVIVILAIILTIIGPKVINVFSGSKQKAYNEQVTTLKGLGKQYATEFPYNVTWTSNVAQVTISQLITAGYVKSNITNAKNGKAICGTSYVTITNTSGVYSYDITIYNAGDVGC